MKGFVAISSVLLFLGFAGVASARDLPLPANRCYGYSADGYLYDFSDFGSRPYIFQQGTTTIVVSLCDNVQLIDGLGSNLNITYFGTYNTILPVNDTRYSFVQSYNYGDVAGCSSYKSGAGRDVSVNVICGECPHEVDAIRCVSKPCICSAQVSPDGCSIAMDMAMDCPEDARYMKRIASFFNMGLAPGDASVVKAGLPTLAYNPEALMFAQYTFVTEQQWVYLYAASDANDSPLMGKPSIEVRPSSGLAVSLQGSGTKGGSPTVVTPLIFALHMRCTKVRKAPYLVNVTIPFFGYSSVNVTLGKMCTKTQSKDSDSSTDDDDGGEGHGFLTVLLIVLIVAAVTILLFGVVYNMYVLDRRGLAAMPVLGDRWANKDGGGHDDLEPGPLGSAAYANAVPPAYVSGVVGVPPQVPVSTTSFGSV